jgi:hypothetical protein
MTLILSGTDGLSDVDGSAATPAIRGTDANTGIFFGADIIGFAEGGAEVARFNADAQFVAAAGTASLPVITTTGDVNTGIFFPAADQVAITTGGTQRAVVDASGNLGVGTTSPANKLDVVASGDVAKFGNTKKLFVSTDSAGFGLFSAASQANTGIYASDTSNFIYFATSSAERARIDSSGNLLVGANALRSAERMIVEKNNDVICAKATGGISSIPYLAWNDATSGDNSFMNFGTEASYTSRGNIDYNRAGGLVRYNTSSDATLKNIIGDSDGIKSIEILNSTRIRDYSWKDDATNKTQIGVIAQELYETYKGAVSVGGEIEKTDEEGNVTTEYRPWAVDKTAFTFHLVKGWQEHHRIIQEQQALITALQADVAALKGTA